MIGNSNFLLAPWGEDARRAGEGLFFFTTYGILLSYRPNRVQL